MNKFMKLAIEEAKEGISNGHGGPFGAVIVKDGNVIASGHNHVVINNDPTCHGEINAIRKACQKLGTFDLSGCEIYTTHYPCPMCACAIKWANIKTVYYGCTIEDTEKIGFRDKEFYDEEKEYNECEIDNYIELERNACVNLSNEYMNMEHTMY